MLANEWTIITYRRFYWRWWHVGGQQHQHRLSEETRGRCEGLIILDFCSNKKMILNPVDMIDPAATAGAAESLWQKVQPPLSKMQSRKVNNATAAWRVCYLFSLRMRRMCGFGNHGLPRLQTFTCSPSAHLLDLWQFLWSTRRGAKGLYTNVVQVAIDTAT